MSLFESLKLAAKIIVCCLALFGLSVFAAVVGGRGSESQTIAAWVQAFGSIFAIAGAYHLSDRQNRNGIIAINRAHELTVQTKVAGYMAVVDAAMLHIRRFGEAMLTPNPAIVLYQVYDKTVVQGARTALLGIPPHELGNLGAINPLLSMRDQLLFVELALETYLAGPSKHPQLSMAIASVRYADDPAQYEQVRSTADAVLRSNVQMHISRAESDYIELCNAMGREPTAAILHT